jgi:DNA polymerase I-like protein with 3'-5' exonuclease and polymerase domains
VGTLEKLIRTGKEAIKLHQEFEVDIVTLGRLSMATPNVMAIEIDT